MKKIEKFGREFCLDCIRQIFQKRAVSGKGLTADECSKLSELMMFSAKRTTVSGMRASHILQSFAGDYTPPTIRTEPSPPRRHAPTDIMA